MGTAVKAIHKLEKTTESNAQAIKENSQAIHKLEKITESNAQGLEQLRVTMAQTIDMFSDSMRVMRQMQGEIKGIQTENQRILRHLFQEPDN